MKERIRLFCHRDPYDWEHTETLFLEAVKQNVEFHKRHCLPYARMLRQEGFHVTSLRTVEDIAGIPVIPTLYFKKHGLYSVPHHAGVMEASSSGTKGRQSLVRIDRNSLAMGIAMACRTFAYHGLMSPVPVHYMILGYPLMKGTNKGAVLSSNGAAWMAPALSRTHVLAPDEQGDYRWNGKRMTEDLIRFSRGKLPVRFMGFPAYMNAWLDELKEHNIAVRLPKGSVVLLGGGWKQYHSERIERAQLYEKIEECLGISKECCHDFFSAVEHPVMYASCRKHHFHVPIYSRVIIRDCHSLEPLPAGAEGLLSFVTPLMMGMPLTSVVTDDIGVLHEAGTCGCGIESPWFELHQRTGMEEIRTCAADTEERLGGMRR